jgi:hypothetical protein
MSETHTKTGEGVLVDAVRESPVDLYLLRHRRRLLLALLLIVVLLLAWCLFRRGGDKPAEGKAAPGYAAAAGPKGPDPNS